MASILIVITIDRKLFSPLTSHNIPDVWILLMRFSHESDLYVIVCVCIFLCFEIFYTILVELSCKRLE